MSVTLRESSPEQVTEPMSSAASALKPSVWRALLRNPLAVASLTVLAVITLAAIFLPMVMHYRYDVQTDDILKPPSAKHWLGTDDVGYDLAVRLAVGARISLGIGVGVETLVILVGVTVGLLAGYYGKFADTALMRLTDMMFAFPDILLAILIMAVLTPTQTNIFTSLANVFAALTVTGWPGLARLVRSQTIALKGREFVEAARALGVPNREIMLKHILPNLLSFVVVASTVDIAGVIVAEATLSFLGLGVPTPLPSWGAMISAPIDDGRYAQHPEFVLYPAVCLTLVVLSFNFLGDALRDALDPRSK